MAMWDSTNWFSSEGLRNSSYKIPGYNTKQSDGEVSVMLKLWGI